MAKNERKHLKGKYLLAEDKTLGESSGQLKNFLQCLNYFNKTRSHKFTFVSEQCSLVPNLSLKQNTLLNSISLSLTSSKEENFERKITDKGNPALTELYQSVQSWDKLPNANPLMINKIVSFIKVFLQATDYIFLEYPETHLNDKTIQLVSQALSNQLSNFDTSLIMISHQPERWEGLIGQSILKSPEGLYVIKPFNNNSRDHLQTTASSSSCETEATVINLNKNKSAA